MLKVVILAGGLGTRLQELTNVIPKPMVEVGGRPVLWHIMKLYAHYGMREFCVALGYKGSVIKSYFLNYRDLVADLTVKLSPPTVEHRSNEIDDWTVHLIDTGLDTDTGGRIRRLKDLIGKDTFLMTYGDGVADIDIGALVDFHRRSGRLATVTAVRPPARFGALDIDGERVARFTEKPIDGDTWINGGFFVLEPSVLDFIADDTTAFEHEPLRRLAAEGQLGAYRHSGFWQCMDTLRDVRQLNDLWDRNVAPWKNW